MLSEIVSFSLLCFTSVLFIVNPLSAAMLFLSLTPDWEHRTRLRTAWMAVLVAGGVLILFTLTGNLIFRMFGISLGAFRVAGGILLLLVAMDMLHGKHSPTKTTPEDRAAAAEKEQIGVSPMGVPQLAGPGAIATVILLPGEPREIWRVVPVVVAIVVVLAITYGMLCSADRLQKHLGQAGTRVVTKIMGLLIAAVAIQFIALGIRDLMPIFIEKIPKLNH